MRKMTLQQALAAGTQLQKAGRFDEAENVYRQLLAQDPNFPDALHLLGVLLFQRGQHQPAIDLVRRAIAIYPNGAMYHSNLARILMAAKKVDEAIVENQRVVALQPDNAQAFNDLGTVLFTARRVQEAIAAYRRAVEIQPEFASAWSNLANSLHVSGQLSEALECCGKALLIQPNYVEAKGVLGNILCDLDRFDEAIAEYQQAIVLRPDMPEMHNNLGLGLFRRGRYDEAIAALDKAIALQPDYANAWSNRAKVLRDCSRLEEAAAAAYRALAISPDLAAAHLNLATIFLDAARLGEAIKSARRSLELSPELSTVHNFLGNALKDDGSVEAAIASFDRAMALKPKDAAVHSNKVYTMQFLADCDGRALFEEQRRWNDLHARPVKQFGPCDDHDRTADRKLRVGYVSPNFHSHAESFFVVPLLESHDHSQIELHCYSDVIREDSVTERLRRCTDVWHNCLGLTDDELAGRIQGDRIDILVDLSMHMARNRELVFARKPAPIQVAWLAYPGGTGLDAMDYRITDPWIDPLGIDESVYHEQSIRLPNSWVCYDPLSEILPSAARTGEAVCFGSINNPCKLNEPLLRLWARVIQAVPDSRLLLQVLGDDHRQRILDLYRSLDISPERLEFVGRCGRGEYLRLYDRIDICLDPLPYNGITTTCDALWMGAPVVTLAGKTAAGRAGVSILMNVGLGELTAREPDEFVNVARSLAMDHSRRVDLRSTLRRRIQQSPLMNFRQFAHDMESAYRQMWRQWCKGGTKPAIK
jgi:predicted O-linked N-acetylglucosamine transferase (SPINDLY family)